MAEGDGPDGPFQPVEGPQAGQLVGVPQRDQGVRAAHREVLAGWVELDTDAVAGVGLGGNRKNKYIEGKESQAILLPY